MMCGDRWLETGSPWEGDEMTEREQLENLRKLATAATQGNWTACRMTHVERGDDLTPDELGEYVKNCVLVGGERPFLFVSVEVGGVNVDLCHIGNGPNGPNNAAFIQAANPATVVALLDRIQQLEQAARAASPKVPHGEPVVQLGWMANKPGTMRELQFIDPRTSFDIPVGTKFYLHPPKPALPQGVEEWIADNWWCPIHNDEECDCGTGFVPADALESYLSGMAIVPVDVIDDLWACAHSGHSLEDLKSKIQMLAATKEKQL